MNSELDILFSNTFGQDYFLKKQIITNGGSDRVYERHFDTRQNSFIGVASENIDENKAFIKYSQVLENIGVSVPYIISKNTNESCYFQSDLGDRSLLNKLLEEGFTLENLNLYKQSLSQLVLFQTQFLKHIEEEDLFVKTSFSEHLIRHDLNYFKYNFALIQLSSMPSELIQEDISNWISQFSNSQITGFIYRDFQARNIFVFDNKPFFIDFQGGMKGPLLYDVASILWQAKAALPYEWKQELLEYYICDLQAYFPQISHEIIRTEYLNYTLLRLLQVMGAYGFRGLIQQKRHFLESIEIGKENLRFFLKTFPDLYIPKHYMNMIIKSIEK